MPRLLPKYVSDDEILEQLKRFSITLDGAIKQGLTKNGFSMIYANKILEKHPESSQTAIAKHIARRLSNFQNCDDSEQEDSYPIIEFKDNDFPVSSIINESGNFKVDLGRLLQDILGKFSFYEWKC